MTEHMGSTGWNPSANELERIAETSDKQKEKIAEREIMTKIQHLFEYPERCEHCLPDAGNPAGDRVMERISYLRDDEGEHLSSLTYRRLHVKRDTDDGERWELDLQTQVIRYTEMYQDVPGEILIPNHWPEAEVDLQMLQRVESLINKHLLELAIASQQRDEDESRE